MSRLRQTGSRAQSPSTRKRSARSEPKRTATKIAGKRYSFTLNAKTGKVEKVEILDARGARYEVSDQEKESLAQQGRERLESALEEAFEAGIDCVLGDGGTQDDTEESEKDAELRQELLTPLIQHSPANRFLKREVLDRAILETLIQHSINPQSNGPRE